MLAVEPGAGHGGVRTKNCALFVLGRALVTGRAPCAARFSATLG